MDKDCIFCKIVAGTMEADIVYQDDKAVAFKDINPAAPHHVLIIPREHVASVNEASENNESLMGHLLTVAARIAKQLGVDRPGYRLVISTNADGGQLVFHLHVHLLAGRKLGWPPG